MIARSMAPCDPLLSGGRNALVEPRSPHSVRTPATKIRSHRWLVRDGVEPCGQVTAHNLTHRILGQRGSNPNHLRNFEVGQA